MNIKELMSAYETLSDQKKRRDYDKERGRLRREGKLAKQDFAETFEKGAYASDNESSDDSNNDERQPISKEKEAIIEEMGPFVLKLLKFSDKDSEGELRRLTDRMMEQNKSEENFVTSHCPPIDFFLKVSRKRKKYLKTSGDQMDVKAEGAKRKLKKLQIKLENQLDELELPRTWASLQSNPYSKNEPNRKSAEETQSSNRPTSTEEDPMDLDPSPGLTSQCEKILAYRPICRTVIEKGTGRQVVTETVNDFVIYKQGYDNPIEIVNMARVGVDAANAYLAQSDDKKVNISNSHQKYNASDRQYIGDVIGFARKDSISPAGNLPWGVVLVNYNGDERIMNRSALRRACGKNAADQRINQYLDNINEEPEESRHVRLKLRLEHTKGQLQLEERSTKYRRGKRVTSATNTEHTTVNSEKSSPQKQSVPQNEMGQPMITRTEVDDMMERMMEGMMERMMERMTEQITKKLGQFQLKP
jgi:hypothetical protein